MINYNSFTNEELEASIYTKIKKVKELKKKKESNIYLILHIQDTIILMQRILIAR